MMPPETDFDIPMLSLMCSAGDSAHKKAIATGNGLTEACSEAVRGAQC